MQRKHILFTSALLAILVAGMFLFAYLSRQQVEAPAPSETVATSTDPFEDITRINAKHFFTDPPGIHTLAGELPMPTPCDLLTTNAVLLDNGSRALVSFDVVNNAGGQCEQNVNPQRFKVGFQAPKDIKIEAVFKGRPVELNLIPAQDGERPQDFELFIKG